MNIPRMLVHAGTISAAIMMVRSSMEYPVVVMTSEKSLKALPAMRLLATNRMPTKEVLTMAKPNLTKELF